tara:strand:+ start:1500 stop:1700 length:201 start_codon:yes stop_codon:yes gene_type:complete
MKNINSLSKGYSKSTPNTRSKKEYIPSSPKKANVEEIYNKIKMLYSDGNLSINDITTIINELQKIT